MCTATGRAVNPDPSGWTLTEHLLALAVDEMRVANWQRSKAGQKGHNRPKPISPLMRRRGKRIGKTTRRPAEVAALLTRLGPEGR